MTQRARWRRSTVSSGLIAALASLAVMLLACAPETLTIPQSSAAPSSAGSSADQFLIVDCLLPGQIRQLGQRATYVSRRPVVRTSGSDCGIRGGEYVAYDRADYKTALQVWLPKAEDGDAQAQTYVGEIYEKGLGTAPDYAKAAQWYQKAADQGYAPAKINLGFLYDKGQGVEHDPQQATNLYAQASGLPASGVQFVAANDAELTKVREQLEQERRETGRVRSELESTRQQLEAARTKLSESQTRVEEKQQDLSSAEQAVAQREAQVAADRERLRGERERLRQLEAENARLAAARAAPPPPAGLSDADRQRMEDLKRQAETIGKEADALRASLAGQQQTLSQREADLATQKKEVAAKQAEIDRLNTEVAKLKRDAERRETAAAQQVPKPAAETSKTVALAAPVITIVDPVLPSTRGKPVVTLRAALPNHVVVGRVEAPAGLLKLTVNDVERPVDQNNLFQADVPVGKSGTAVTVAAIDRQGRRSALEFVLKPGGSIETAARGEREIGTAAIPTLDLDFGSYYALVIGNNAYSRLPQLKTAVADAQAVSQILEGHYGFKVTTLLNANRYDILSALNKMREKLTEKDNLVIYYAGHGELDEVNQRGNWLPVDAEPDSTANWISNTSITDILNAMSAKHVLVISDSCYAGALTRSAMAQLDPGMSAEVRSNWLRTMLKQKSRTALTSGGVQPVIDNVGGKHSVFAQALLDALSAQSGVFEAQRLFRDVAAKVSFVAERYRVEQVPEYAPIRYAGHGGGDFLFVREG